MEDAAEVLDHLPDEVGIAEVGHMTGGIAARSPDEPEVRRDNENRMVSTRLSQPLEVANGIYQGPVRSYN